jgi:DNA polymerase III epsilon subunit-like protein
MKPNVLFIDIETAPITAYVWGLFDQNVSIDQIVDGGYVLCVSWKWQGEKVPRYIRVDGNEKAALKVLHEALDKADYVVHYNGIKFDIPTLHRELLLHGFAPPSPVREIDLLRVVRRKFRFSSNKLDYVCQRLGLGNKVHHKGMELWKGCMGNKAASWKVMKEYNTQDVVLLEKLYNKLLPWIPNHPNVTLYTGDVAACPRCGSEHYSHRGMQHNETRAYSDMKKELKKVGGGELENNKLKRLLDAWEEEELAEQEIRDFLNRVTEREMDDDRS